MGGWAGRGPLLARQGSVRVASARGVPAEPSEAAESASEAGGDRRAHLQTWGCLEVIVGLGRNRECLPRGLSGRRGGCSPMYRPRPAGACSDNVTGLCFCAWLYVDAMH